MDLDNSWIREWQAGRQEGGLGAAPGWGKEGISTPHSIRTLSDQRREERGEGGEGDWKEVG